MDFEKEWRELAMSQREIIDAYRKRNKELQARLDQLQNEVNAVEWVNGRIEKELFECRKR